jgi:predicted AAA+ superfamily ATPase
LVTGSSKLNTYRKVGDSMAGRFFHHRLHPLDIKELSHTFAPTEILTRLLKTSGFPEPFLEGSETFYKRWRRTHIDIILRQDLLDTEAVSDLRAMETLIELLRHRVGAPVSYANLARDLEKDPKTVKRWLEILENHYVLFRVTPYHRNIARSLLKEPKYYFYDAAQVIGDTGVQLENIVALALRKELDRLEDLEGERTGLYYLRNKQGQEIDFAVSINNRMAWLIEVKSSDPTPSPHFGIFAKYFSNAKFIQLVGTLKREQMYPNGVQILDLVSWLATCAL